MGTPAEKSYNDAMDKIQLSKLKMATVKDFAQAAAAAGKGATMSKIDLKDAYKIVPCHPNLWARQGFSWLGKYFVNLTTIFGSKAAPADFDCVAKTISQLPKAALGTITLNFIN